MAQFIVSQAEAIEMIRRQFMLPTTVEVIIEQTTEPIVEDDGWIDVPADWTNYAARATARQYQKIEVMFGDGNVNIDHPSTWSLSWGQTGDSNFNIMKFRPVK